MISLIEFRKQRLIEIRKAFKNNEDIEKHILKIKSEILNSNKDKRMVELKNWLNQINQNKPSILPFLFNLILSAAGTLGNPGIVIIDPQTATINSAPDDNFTSLIGIS